MPPSSNLSLSCFIGEVEQLGDQENIDNVGPADGGYSDNISKRFKTPKRINHKGETMLHVLAMKVNINVVLCYIYAYQNRCSLLYNVYSTNTTCFVRIFAICFLLL